MDIKALTDYAKGLTEAELEEHAQIEAELNNMVREGFSERAALSFVLTVVSIRKKMPEATIEGVFDVALIGGLELLLSRLRAETQPARRVAPKRRTRSGVRLET
jgi:hypothetical protein